MATQSGKIAEVFFESVLETIEDQTQLSDMCSRFEPGAASMQNSSNFVWRPVEQQAVITEGWDLSGVSDADQDIIEETYPAILGLPKNDLVKQRADDLRDMEFWRRRGKRSGKQQVVEQNTAIANAIKTQGALYYRSNDTSGFDFISEAQALMNEQQRTHDKRSYILNDRDTKKFGEDLAKRETIKGRPSDTWATGQIGSNVAEFDIYTGSYLPTLAGGAAVDTTVTGAQSFKPEAGTVDSGTGDVSNVDYRKAVIAVAASASYNIGDKVIFDNGGTTVKAIGISDKTDTGVAKTFTVIAKPSGTSITVYPKPIAFDDGSLSAIEKASANIDTVITNGALVTRVNSDANAKTNLFFDMDAVEILSGTIPANLFAEFEGMKVISHTMKNGQEMYMLYDANIISMTFRYRLFTWWGVTIKDPQRCGVSVTF